MLLYPDAVGPKFFGAQNPYTLRLLPAVPPHPDLVERFMAEGNMSAAQRQKRTLQAVQREFQRFDGDTGSSEVQGTCPMVQGLQMHIRREGATLMMGSTSALAHPPADCEAGYSEVHGT